MISIEVSPSHVDKFINEVFNKNHLSSISKKHLKIFITHVNGDKYEEVITACRRLISEEFFVVPHLGVRNLGMDDDIDGITSFITNEVTEVLLIGGGNKHPLIYSSVMGFLLREWKNPSLNLDKINFPIYPDGHPHLKDDWMGNLSSKMYYVKKNLNVNKIGVYPQLSMNTSNILSIISYLKDSKLPIDDYTISFAPLVNLKLIKSLVKIIGFKLVIKSVFNMRLRDLKNINQDNLVKKVFHNGIYIYSVHCYSFSDYSSSMNMLSKYLENLYSSKHLHSVDHVS